MFKAEDSSAVGLSGKRAKVVWKSFQAARPSSAFRVSLPSLGAMAWPVRSGPLGEGEDGMSEEGFCLSTSNLCGRPGSEEW